MSVQTIREKLAKSKANAQKNFNDARTRIQFAQESPKLNITAVEDLQTIIARLRSQSSAAKNRHEFASSED